MPITMTVDHEHQQIVAVATGPIRYAEIAHHLSDERAYNGLAHTEFIDACDATLSFVLYPSEIRQIVALVRSLAKDSKLGPTAILVPNDFAFGIVHMLGILIEDVAELRPFRSEPEARAWLATK
jgi:hypothetical protein